MKKMISLLLSLMLLFSGCQGKKDVMSTNTPQETEVPSASQPTQAPQETVQTFESGVYTDYSKYGQREPAVSLYTRLREDFISELEPREDYGMLYPFIGDISETQWYEESPLYGLVDQSGRIVVDPVYCEVNQLSAYDSSTSKVNTAPIWVLEKIVNLSEDDLEWRYAFATLDGSFVSDCVYSSVSLCDEGILAQREMENGRLELSLFDLEGNLIKTKSNLPTDAAFYSYREGMITINTEENGQWYQYYTDWEGNHRLGPYTYAEPFSCGYGLVTLENENQVFVDKEGNYLLDRELTSALSFSNGIASGIDTESGEALLFDTEGRIILSLPGIKYQYWNGYCYQTTAWDDTRMAYDTQGNVLYGGPLDGQWDVTPYRELIYNYALGAVKNCETGKEYTSKGGINAYIEFLHDYGTQEDLPYFTVRWWDDDNESHYALVNMSFEELLTGKGYLKARQDWVTGKAYFSVENGNRISLYTADGELLLELIGSYCDIYNGRIICTDDFCCRQYDLGGNLLFSYPLSSVGAD